MTFLTIKDATEDKRKAVDYAWRHLRTFLPANSPFLEKYTNLDTCNNGSTLRAITQIVERHYEDLAEEDAWQTVR